MLKFNSKGFRFFFFIIILFYLIYGHCIGQIVKPIVRSAFEEYTAVENNPYAAVISDELYNRLTQRKYLDFTLQDTYDKYHLSHPFVLHWFTGANVYVRYNYAYYQNGEQKSGSLGAIIEFTLVFQNGHWKIVDVYEAP